MFRDDERGVSEVIGYVLISVTVVISLTWLMAAAMPMLDQVQSDASFSRSQNDLAALQKTMEEVAHGPLSGPGMSRRVEFSLSQGTLEVRNRTGKLNVSFTVSTDSLTGTLTDNVSGNAVQGAKVSVVGRNTVTRSDSSGGYSVELGTGDTYLLRVTRAGFESANQSITFTEGSSLDFDLKSANGSLSVEVQNGSGSGVANASVELNGTPYSYEATGRGSEGYVRNATTNVSGVADLSSLPTGENYSVKVSKDWYADSTKSGVSVNSGGVNSLNFDLDEAGRVNVTVQNSTGSPLPNASVSVYNFSRPFVSTNSTNASGWTQFKKVPVGTYTVVATDSGRRPNSTTVAVNFKQNSSVAINLSSATNSTWNVTGRVTDSVNGEPVEASWVNYSFSGTNVVSGVDSNGDYSLDVINGSRRLRANATSYESSNQSLTVTSDTASNFTLRHLSTGFFNGYVLNSTGTPVNSASVTIRGETDAGWRFSKTVSSAANGRYNFTEVGIPNYTTESPWDGVPTVELSLEVSKAGYDSRSLRHLLTTDNRSRNVTLSEGKKNSSVSGYVADSAGNPLDGAVVEVVEGSYSDETNASGFYNITLPEGHYDMKASKGDYLPSYAFDTFVQGDEETNFSLQLSLEPGYARLESGSSRAYLENDLLARGEGRQSAYLRNNMVHVENVTSSGDSFSTYLVSIHVLTIESGDFTRGGASAKISVSSSEFNQYFNDRTENVSIGISSEVPGAWERYFNSTLGSVGLTYGNGYTMDRTGEKGLRIDIEGAASGNNDLDFRLVETKLNLEAR